MSALVTVVRDSVRRCGWRKEGGLYLVADNLGEACGRLPLPLGVCPVCGQGIKFSRSWTWIEPAPLVVDLPCERSDGECLAACPLSDGEAAKRQRDGLIWIGKEHYATVQDYLNEVARLGVSRRIRTVPRGFVVGETWVWLAHLEAIPRRDGWGPGVFEIFRPRAVEYITKGDETDEELTKLLDRGITPVKVERVGEQLEIGDGE